MLSEFKQFAMKGNVVDLAVGVIIGGAFGKIVDFISGRQVNFKLIDLPAWRPKFQRVVTWLTVQSKGHFAHHSRPDQQERSSDLRVLLRSQMEREAQVLILFGRLLNLQIAN